MKFTAAIDHLVVAATSLDEGAAWLEDRLGVPLSPGGEHAAMGTHNRLLRLGANLYLELIAVNAAAPPPDRPRWFGLDSPPMRESLSERPRLIHWVARTDDIVAARAACPEPLGDILPMRRGTFDWLITVPADGGLPAGGLVPSLIQWKAETHPAKHLPVTGCALMKLEGFHAGPARIRAALSALGLEKTLALFAAAAGETPALVAYIKTPSGLRELD